MSGFRVTQVIFWLGLSLYLGGLVTLGAIVAWQLFSTLQHVAVQVPGMSAHLNQSRELAGLIFGRMLDAFNVVEILSLGLMFIAITAQMALYLNVLNLWVVFRLVLAILLLAVSFFDIFAVSPAVHQEHRKWMGYVDAQPAMAAVHQKGFWKLHAESEHLGMVEIALLLALLFVAAWGVTHPTRRKYMIEITGTKSGAPPSSQSTV